MPLPGAAAVRLENVITACLNSGSLKKSSRTASPVVSSSESPRAVSRQPADCLLYSPYAHALLSFCMLKLVQHSSSFVNMLHAVHYFAKFSLVTRLPGDAEWTDIIDPIAELFCCGQPVTLGVGGELVSCSSVIFIHVFTCTVIFCLTFCDCIFHLIIDVYIN